MMTSSSELPISFQESIEYYKEGLARRLGDRFDDSWWLPQLELSQLGVFAEAGVFKAYFAAHSDSALHRRQNRLDLEWWAERAQAGARWLAK